MSSNRYLKGDFYIVYENTGFKCWLPFFTAKKSWQDSFIFYIEIKGENHYNNVRVTAWNVFEKGSGSKEAVTAVIGLLFNGNVLRGVLL